MKFTTISGSIYEVDRSKKRIRRLLGETSSVNPQDNDGEWKIYIRMNAKVGEKAVIAWDSPIRSSTATLGLTTTSQVVSIEEGGEDAN